MRYATPHASSFVERRIERLDRPAEIGNRNPSDRIRRELTHDVDIGLVDAEDETGARVDRSPNLVDVEGVDADAHSRIDQLTNDIRQLRKRQTRGTSDVDDVSAGGAIVLGFPADLLAGQARRVVDLGEDLDVPGTVFVRPQPTVRSNGGFPAGRQVPWPRARRPCPESQRDRLHRGRESGRGLCPRPPSDDARSRSWSSAPPP